MLTPVRSKLSNLQKEQFKLGNVKVRYEKLAAKDSAYNVKNEQVSVAYAALKDFLEGFAGCLADADLMVKDDDKSEIAKLTEQLGKLNSASDTHLSGVRACLKECKD